MTMEWYEIELDGHRTCKFPDNAVPGYEQTLTRPINERGINPDYIGGILNGGKWGWISRQNWTDATLLICSLDSGDRVARHTFWRLNEKKPAQGIRCSIHCVVELFPGEHNGRVLLAVCIKVGHTKTDLIIYTPTSSQVLRYIDLHSAGIYARTLSFFNSHLCRLTLMHNFDGCLAVGTSDGTVLLMDINATQVIDSRSKNLHRPDRDLQRARMKCRNWNELNWNSVNAALQECRNQDVHLALEVNMHISAVSTISCLLPIEFISGFAAGLQDGRILIYDLNDNRLVTILSLPAKEPTASVERMCYIVPPDDPKPCFYICAVYNQGERLMTTLHSMNYKRSVEQAENKSLFLFRDFQCAATRVRLLLDESKCSVIDCNTISTFPFVGDNGTLLTAISWHSHKDLKNKFILFDINQWYKDEMPSQPRKEKPNYLCGYVLSGLHTGLSIQLDPSSVMHFVSQQRHDEHFYPNSLSFECFLLTYGGCRRYVHVGLQRRFLGAMCSQKASLFLHPEPYQEEIMGLRLMPQFCEHNVNATFSRRAMYELILSVALEHNRIGLLNNCVQNCLDGSFMCNMLSNTKLSLSILTNWIVKRAGQIKERCSELCHGIFEYGGYSLDEREREEFQVLNAQLLRLQQLQLVIGQLGKTRLSPEILEDLQSTEQTLAVLYEYHRVVFWLIEHEILPEGYEIMPAGVPPLQLIRRDYEERRLQMRKHNAKLYIDEMLQFSCFLPTLQESSYPPPTLQALMHVLLLQDGQLSHKHELLLYLLLDWDELQSRRQHRRLFEEFVLAFDIAAPLVRSVRSFWLLDRGHITQAVEELYKSRCSSNNYTAWQTKLLLDVLLAHGAVKQAMQVLDQPPGTISSLHQLQVLLANNNIPEAFHHARLYEDEQGRPLLEYFFEHCIRGGMFKVLGSLCLREHEEHLVYRLLRKCKTRRTDAVQLILLLKRCKYIEAVSFMDEVAAEQQRSNMGDNLSEETNTLLSAYRTTMAPVTQSIAGTYFRIRDKLNGDQLKNCAPEPFSCQLAKQNATGQLGGIFQSSALSAHWATRYVTEPRSLNSQNMPFLRNAAQARNQLPQHHRLVRPTPFQAAEKRRLVDKEQLAQQPSKRRRLLGEQFGEEVSGLIKRSLHLAQQQEQEKLQLQDQQEVQALLTPPAYLEFKGQPVPSNNVEAKRPPILLKRRPAPSPRPSASPAPSVELLEQQSSFRFMPPIPLEEQRAQLEGDSMELDEDETDEIFVEFDQQASSPTPSQLQQMISDASGLESEGDAEPEPDSERQSDSESDSEYLSPLASANASFALIQQQFDMEERQRELERQLQREQERQHQQSRAPPTGPQPRSSLLPIRSEQESSGFGSFGTIQVANTGSLQLDQFVPPVCSSKMCEVPSMLPSSSSSSMMTTTHVKLSERTTICGDLEEPSVVASPSLWTPIVSTVPAYVPPTLQMLDTTLGMSSYDVTAFEMQAQVEHMEQQQEEREQRNRDRDREQQQEEREQHEREREREQQQQQPEEQQQSSRSSSEQEEDEEEVVEPSSAMDYNQTSPSYSISSELSDMSSTDLVSSHPNRQDAPVYSIVVESTNSITTSRSPTSHTPTSFLPSDTNVSQNSSPRAAHGGAGDGSNRSLYRANSLETVDDLDTTKGSLEEDDDVDEEDECVIALDGTEVRGYVARPEPMAACSSAELFAFKKSEEATELAAQVPCPSLGATANSDSVMAYTINLDSSDEAPMDAAVAPSAVAPVNPTATVPIATEEASSNDSIATVAFSEHKQHDAEVELPTAEQVDSDLEIIEPAAEHVDSDVESQHSLRLALSEGEEDKQQWEQEQPELETITETDPVPVIVPIQPVVRVMRQRRISMSSASPPPRRIRLRSDDQRTSPSEGSARSTPTLSPTLPRRRRRSNSQGSDDLATSTETTPTLPIRKYRLRSSDSMESEEPLKRNLRGGSMPAMSTVPVSTPKRRQKLLPKPLEVIQENAESIPRTRSRTRLSQVTTPISSLDLVPDVATSSGSRTRRSLRCLSEPPVVAKPPIGRKRGRPSRDSMDAQDVPATPPAPPISTTTPTTGRILRSRRSSLLDQPAIEQAAPSPSPAPQPDVGHVNEANVPPKKRGRNKKE